MAALQEERRRKGLHHAYDGRFGKSSYRRAQLPAYNMIRSMVLELADKVPSLTQGQ